MATVLHLNEVNLKLFRIYLNSTLKTRNFNYLATNKHSLLKQAPALYHQHKVSVT